MIDLSFNVYTLLITIAVIIAITFGVLLLFSRHENKTADRFLAVVMFIVAMWNISLLLLELNIYRYAVGVIWVPFTYTLALGPCLYFYVHYLTNSDAIKKQRIWPHFIPVLLQVGIFLFEVFIGIPQSKAYFQTDLFLITDPIINILAIASVLTYGYFSRQKVIHYHQWVKNNYSHYHRYNLNWLVRLSSVFIVLLIIWLLYVLVDYFQYDYKLTFKDYYPFHLALAVISIWLSYEAYSKPEIHFTDETIDHNKAPQEKPDVDVNLQEQAKWLREQIEQNRLYLDPELSLKSLADTLEIHPNATSKLINEGIGKTFSDCINEYRVAAVKLRLENPDFNADTYLAIAFDCGFNSKTTFNRIFKKYVGQTPAKYRESKQKTQ